MKSVSSESVSNSNSSSSNSNNNRCQFRTEFDKVVLTHNFDIRFWSRCSNEFNHLAKDWNFYWASVTTVKSIFNPETGYRLTDQQIINHFPNHYELTRKDLMVKNFKKYRKELEANNSVLANRDTDGNYIYLDLIPTTYLMPSDYSLLLEEFRKNPNSVWICKPNSKSQGNGIIIMNKLTQIKKFAQQKLFNQPNTGTARDNYVISRYVENPLLIGGKKFDLRLYVLVTNYKPLRVYMFQQGFARFCNVKYSSNIDELDNQYIHLTNVAIQKHGDEYNEKHGNKWSIQHLKLYLQSTRGFQQTQALFDSIDFIIIHSLKAVQNVIINDKHCFECYGYDLLIDSNLKPWLLEVNASPSLSVTTKPDKLLKMKLINDLLNVVIPPGFPNNCKDNIANKGTSWSSALQVGDFRLLYDELLMEGGTGINNANNFNLNSTGNISNSSASNRLNSATRNSNNFSSTTTRENSSLMSSTGSSNTTAVKVNRVGKWR